MSSLVAQADRDAKASVVKSWGGGSSGGGPFLDMSQFKEGKEALRALMQAELELQRWQDAATVLEQLAAIPEDPNPYVAALVLDRTPMCPKPGFGTVYMRQHSFRPN